MSAGGIDPVQDLFRAVAPETGMAFILMHHLREEFPTALVPILSHCTRMPVELAQTGMRVEPNHVYILPSGQEVELDDGAFQLRPRSKLLRWPNLVSLFIESMSRTRHPGLAIILSGMDADGAAALLRLKKHGGTILAQLPSTAYCPDMPRAAIRTGAVDYVLDARGIGTRLTELALDRVLATSNGQPA